MVKNKCRFRLLPALEVDRSKSFKPEFKDLETMKAAMASCADLLLFLQDDLNVMRDYSNLFFQEMLVDGEWLQIEEDAE